RDKGRVAKERHPAEDNPRRCEFDARMKAGGLRRTLEQASDLRRQQCLCLCLQLVEEPGLDQGRWYGAIMPSTENVGEKLRQGVLAIGRPEPSEWAAAPAGVGPALGPGGGNRQDHLAIRKIESHVLK